MHVVWAIGDLNQSPLLSRDYDPAQRPCALVRRHLLRWVQITAHSQYRWHGVRQAVASQCAAQHCLGHHLAWCELPDALTSSGVAHGGPLGCPVVIPTTAGSRLHPGNIATTEIYAHVLKVATGGTASPFDSLCRSNDRYREGMRSSISARRVLKQSRINSNKRPSDAGPTQKLFKLL